MMYRPIQHDAERGRRWLEERRKEEARGEVAELRELLLENADMRCAKLRKREKVNFKYFVPTGMEGGTPEKARRYRRYYQQFTSHPVEVEPSVVPPRERLRPPPPVSSQVAASLTSRPPAKLLTPQHRVELYDIEASFCDSVAATVPQDYSDHRKANGVVAAEAVSPAPSSGCGLTWDQLPI